MSCTLERVIIVPSLKIYLGVIGRGGPLKKTVKVPTSTSLGTNSGKTIFWTALNKIIKMRQISKNAPTMSKKERRRKKWRKYQRRRRERAVGIKVRFGVIASPKKTLSYQLGWDFRREVHLSQRALVSRNRV